MTDELPEPNKPTTPKIEGLLLVLTVLLVVHALQLLSNIQTALSPILDGKVWDALTTPGTNAYNPLWRYVLYYRVFVQFLLGLSSASVAILLLMKHRQFPKCFVVFLALQVFVAVCSLILSHIVTPQATDDQTKQLVQSVVVFALGGVYILESERVKLTFHPQSSNEKVESIIVY
jgi:hypothetical protein